ncbi:MAG: hypothetical protein ACO3EZ_04120 [Prochlorotrichaceae cyanobacterium]|jgi:hypothetical protein
MKQGSTSISSTQHPATLGERIRKIADELREETNLQIKVTSRILGASAKISENYERLIDEVVDMVEEDLNQETDIYTTDVYTVETLKKEFKTLEKAKKYFGLKASSWVSLVKKLNTSPHKEIIPSETPKVSVIDRLDIIEKDIQALRIETSQVLALLRQLILDE